jgi:hypothetical protein
MSTRPRVRSMTKIESKTVYILTDISPNNWWTHSKNHREITI